jgi:hypothetical protein
MQRSGDVMVDEKTYKCGPGEAIQMLVDNP